VRLGTFSALALYGVLRWNTLMKPAAAGRMLALLALAVTIVACGLALNERRRWALAIGALVAVAAMFPIAGVPLSWVRHVRIEVAANAIGQGLSALPNVLVPYLGINHWVRVVIVLGGGVLLLDAAVMAAFAPLHSGDRRRAVTALPLVALAVVPSTIVKPGLPYLQGLILFALLAAFMWAERAPTLEGSAAIAAIGLAGIGGMIAAPGIDTHRAWIDYRAIAGRLVSSHAATFNWAQTYGPLVWPHRGIAVFDVQASRPEYWKTEDLDQFDGRGWVAGNTGPPIRGDVVSPAARARWTQTIQVTLRAMRTTNVIAAGDAAEPTHVGGGVFQGISPGTWNADVELQPGASYRVSTYTPNPTGAELAAAGTDYPAAVITDALTLNLPFVSSVPFESGTTQVVFPPFGSSQPGGANGGYALLGRAVGSSPYGSVYMLARRLERGAATPYAFVQRVMHYLLGGGFAYALNPPAGLRYPLRSFLLTTKRGYCQQFAGAMALLLRMGGVPARVAVGFSPGTYDSATHSWVVTDREAHSWVEVWFPGDGWVTFDPTPAGTKQSNGAPIPAPNINNRNALGGISPSRATRSSRAGAGSGDRGRTISAALIVAIVAGAIAAALLAVLALRWRRPQTGEELVTELERALQRCGRPIGSGLTLAALEHDLRRSPDAAGYVRAIRLARYAAASTRPTGVQRRALRAELGRSRALRRLQALWALPPRRVASSSDG
jgi:transglutaminase-like putative cysteine protease